jgi:hypothetical protein
MNLLQCQNKAKESGADNMEFVALFPKGKCKCHWIDAHMGIMGIEGLEGFLLAEDINKEHPELICEPT